MKTDAPVLMQVTLKLAAHYDWYDESWKKILDCPIDRKVIFNVK